MGKDRSIITKNKIKKQEPKIRGQKQRMKRNGKTVI
jgi:hypothetical protein